MATTFVATRGKSTFPAAAAGPAMNLKVATGTIEITANPTAGDIYEMCRLPRGAVVVGGHLMADDLDTGIESLDMDIGWKATSDEVTDTDGFGNLGLLSGDAVTDIKPEVSLFYPLGGVLRTAGPKLFTQEAVVQVYCNTTAATGGTGTMTVVVYYFIDPAYVVT